MVIAKIEISGTSATVIWSKEIPKGLVGGKVQIEYVDERWNQLNKTVVFRSSITRDVLENGSEVIIPADVLEKSGVKLYVGVYGTDAENNLGLPTFWANLGVIRDAADPEADPNANASLPVWARLLERTPDWLAPPGTDDHILNRTHWTTIEPVNNHFDGNLEGRFYLTLNEGYNVVKVSDTVLTAEDLVGSVAVGYEDGERGSIEISESFIEDLSSEGIPAIVVGEAIFCIQEDFTFYGFSFEAGTYFMCYTDNGETVGYIESLSCLPEIEEVFHPLDNRFIDAEWLATSTVGREVILERADQPFYSGTPGSSKQTFQFKLEAGQQYEVYWDGDTYLCSTGRLSEGVLSCVYIGNAHLMDEEYPDTAEPFCILSASLVMIHLASEILSAASSGQHTVSITAVGQVRNRIPFEYMPKRYVFPSDFYYSGVKDDELEVAYFHMMNGGEVYANYSDSKFKVLMIDLDIWDSINHNLVMTNGDCLMMWGKEAGWVKHTKSNFMLIGPNNKKYQVGINSDGVLYTTDVTNQTIYV